MTNQNGEVVATCERVALMRKRPAGNRLMRSLLFVSGQLGQDDGEGRHEWAPTSSSTISKMRFIQSRRKPRGPLVTAAVGGDPGAGPLRYVRVNALGTPWCEGDLEAVLPAGSRRDRATEGHGARGPRSSRRADRALGGAGEGHSEPASSPYCTETPEATLSADRTVLEASAARGSAVGR